MGYLPCVKCGEMPAADHEEHSYLPYYAYVPPSDIRPEDVVYGGHIPGSYFVTHRVDTAPPAPQWTVRRVMTICGLIFHPREVRVFSDMFPNCERCVLVERHRAKGEKIDRVG